MHEKIKNLQLMGSYKVKDIVWEQLFKGLKHCGHLENLGLEFCNLNFKTCQVNTKEN